MVVFSTDQDTIQRTGKALKCISLWRSTQLDSYSLDREIFASLFTKERIFGILKYTKYAHSLLDSSQVCVVSAFIESVTQYAMLASNNCTLGQSLLGIHFESITKEKKLMFVFFTYMLPAIIKTKLANSILQANVLARIKAFLFASENEIRRFNWLVSVIWHGTDLINLILFLRNGMYPSVIERILEIPISPHRIGVYSLAFSYLERKLILTTANEVVGCAMRIWPILKQALVNSLITKIKKEPKICTKNTNVPQCSKCKAKLLQKSIVIEISPCKHLYCHYCCFESNSHTQCYQCKSLTEGFKRVM